jgi:hypothetical protein
MSFLRHLPFWPRWLIAVAACASVPALAVCRIDPFADDDATTRANSLRQACQGPQLDWGLQTPAVNAVQTRFDGLLARSLAPGLESGLRLNWSGARPEQGGGLRTEQALLASGWRWKPDEDVAMNLRFGQELVGAMRDRIALASLWRPTRSGLVFAEWAGSREGTELHHVGLRWWLLGRRLAIDAGARHRPDGIGWSEHRVGLMLDLRP